MKILITGGTGFIGRALILLRAAKFSVIYWLFFADSCVAYMDVGKGREQERQLY